MRTFMKILAIVIASTALLCTSLLAQAGVFEQDSTLNNLVHPTGYDAAPVGTLGGIVRRGSGPIDVVLIPGWGFGADVFDAFMTENASRYRMVAVTLPGFGGTAAPPMPPAGTSYGSQSWTRSAEEAIARLIKQEGLRRPVIVGHFIVGTQIAFYLAANHPELVGGLVIVGGEPMRYYPSRRDSTQKTPMGREERVTGIDQYLAPRWFRTVTKKTFDANNYTAVEYASDTAQASALWQASSEVPLPTMIRYLCEYMAADLGDDFPRISAPTRVLVPAFTAEILADPKQAWVKPFFQDSWQRVVASNSRIVVRQVPNSRVFVTHDQPRAVTDAIAEVAVNR
jgi:pimeloyl-ACP methyl ester carboxylesterase